MNIDRLVAMANDISTFFAAESPPERAAEDVAQHLRRFWEPRMRRQIIAHLREHGGEGLEPLARRAVQALAAADLSGA
jgi:formate dehydrogenase subunit delta